VLLEVGIRHFICQEYVENFVTVVKKHVVEFVKEFGTKRDLSGRLQLPNDRNSYVCSVCEKHFHTAQYLRRHMNIHDSKYQCTECGKCFRNNQQLTVHRRIHSGEKPFECSVCGKRFTQFEHLRKHSRNHSGEKPYKCEVCQKAFSQVASLTGQMRVHTGDKTYKCRECERAFRHSGNLNIHMRIHTGENRSSFHFMTKLSECPVPCSYINFRSTVTEKLIIVLSVENFSRQLRT